MKPEDFDPAIIGAHYRIENVEQHALQRVAILETLIVQEAIDAIMDLPAIERLLHPDLEALIVYRDELAQDSFHHGPDIFLDQEKIQ